VRFSSKVAAPQEPAAATPAAPAACATPAARAPKVREAPGKKASIASAFGVWLAIVLIFVLYSRLSDYLGAFLKTYTYLVKILIPLVLVAAIFGRGLHRALLSRYGVLLTVFTLLGVLSVPFSVWPGGAAQGLIVWLKSYAFYIGVAGLVASAVHVRRALYAIGWSSILTGALTVLLSMTRGSRLEGLGGTVGNPNYLALFLLFGIPPCMLMNRIGGNWVFRLGGGAGALWLSILVLRTGSRGGLVVLLLVLAVIFLVGGGMTKLKLAAGACVLIAWFAFQSPETLVARYRTLVSGPEEQVDVSAPSAEEELGTSVSAEESTRKRIALARKAIDLTLEHPFVGIGMNQFAVASNPEGTNRYGWQATHNSYVQVSSEMGIPALLVFAGLVVLLLKNSFTFSRRLAARKAPGELAPMAECLALSALTLATGAVFANLAYNFFFPVLAAIMAGFEPIARAALAESAPPKAFAPALPWAARRVRKT
jgi:O-antigen ligase